VAPFDRNQWHGPSEIANQKEFMHDLKLVYRATNKETAEDRLLDLEEKWGGKYPIVIESWQRNWEQLSQYFQYTWLFRSDGATRFGQMVPL
jgi:transposase-like protein